LKKLEITRSPEWEELLDMLMKKEDQVKRQLESVARQDNTQSGKAVARAIGKIDGFGEAIVFLKSLRS
jgi:hypothetical protein